NHEADSAGCGRAGRGCWTGDALDLEACSSGLTRRHVLLRGGFLRAPARRAAQSPGGAGELCTDMGNARRIVATAGKDLRFTGALGWLAWDGKRWRRDDTEAVMRHAKRAIRCIFDEAKAAT